MGDDLCSFSEVVAPALVLGCMVRLAPKQSRVFEKNLSDYSKQRKNRCTKIIATSAESCMVHGVHELQVPLQESSRVDVQTGFWSLEKRRMCDWSVKHSCHAQQPDLTFNIEHGSQNRLQVYSSCALNKHGSIDNPVLVVEFY